MTNSSATRYLRPAEAAAYLGIPTSTLAKRRLRGDPPTFAKVGAIVLYDIRILDAWLVECRRSSTSDVGGEAA